MNLDWIIANQKTIIEKIEKISNWIEKNKEEIVKTLIIADVKQMSLLFCGAHKNALHTCVALDVKDEDNIHLIMDNISDTLKYENDMFIFFVSQLYEIKLNDDSRDMNDVIWFNCWLDSTVNGSHCFYYDKIKKLRKKLGEIIALVQRSDKAEFKPEDYVFTREEWLLINSWIEEKSQK